jgi:predicted secreted Zn-dependent protease
VGRGEQCAVASALAQAQWRVSWRLLEKEGNKRCVYAIIEPLILVCVAVLASRQKKYFEYSVENLLKMKKIT